MNLSFPLFLKGKKFSRFLIKSAEKKKINKKNFFRLDRLDSK
jgi:hypothetical protein